MKLTGVFGRLITANFILLIFLSLFMTYILQKTEKLNLILHQITSVELPLIEKTDRLMNAVVGIEEFRDKYLIAEDEDFLHQYENYKISAALLLNDIDSLIAIEKRNVFDSLSSSFAEYISLNTLFLEKQEGIEKPSPETVTSNISALRKLAAAERGKGLKLSEKLSREVNEAAIAVGFAGVVLIILLAFLNTRNIVLPIKKLRKSTHLVAGGLYPEDISSDGPYEIRQLADDFSVMVRRLKENDELRSEFIGNVSHELRTPLTSIKEASEMLKEDYFRDDRRSSENLLYIINSESERMINSVNNILEITRLDMAKSAYDFESADIGKIAASAIAKTAPIAERRKIDISSEIQKGIKVAADTEKLSVVFANLIGNALKYSPENTRIRITAENKDGFICVCVSDQGIGVSEDELTLIFERYRRGSNRTPEYKGTGLGLAICSRIIEKHGGEIWAESSGGEGSRFYFTLRCA